MHIAVCGPVTLRDLDGLLDAPMDSQGYPFPMTAALVNAYLRLGHQVSVITTGPDVTRLEENHGANLSVYVAPSRARPRDRALDFFALERRGVAELLQRARPDVAHVHWTYEFALGARSTNIPTLITIHDWAPAVLRALPDPYRSIRLLMQAAVLLRAGFYTAPSEYIAQRVRKVYRRTCDVVANGVELGPPSAAVRNFRVSEKAEIRVGAMSNSFSALKNITTLLVCWPKVISSFPTAQLILAGPDFAIGGPAYRWASEKRLTEQVSWIGPITKGKRQFFGSLDLFVHPSKEESFGLVLVEAMAEGVPVVGGRRSGAVPSVIGDAGVLLDDVTSAAEMSDSIVSTLRDESLRRRLSQQGLARSRAYDIEVIASKYLRMLSEIASNA